MMLDKMLDSKKVAISFQRGADMCPAPAEVFASFRLEVCRHKDGEIILLPSVHFSNFKRDSGREVRVNLNVRFAELADRAITTLCLQGPIEVLTDEELLAVGEMLIEKITNLGWVIINTDTHEVSFLVNNLVIEGFSFSDEEFRFVTGIDDQPRRCHAVTGLVGKSEYDL